MKKFGIIFFLLIVTSCSDSDDEMVLTESLPQIWELASINVGISGEILEDNELPWQETLVLNSDNSFVRTRIYENETITATGRFMLLEAPEERQLILVYNDDSPLIENCSNSNEERLRFVSANQLSGGAVPCDGPGLFYVRIA